METDLSVAKMAEAHLINVQREIASLNDQKTKIDGEIKRLAEYLNKGIEILRGSTPQQNADPTEAFKG